MKSRATYFFTLNLFFLTTLALATPCAAAERSSETIDARKGLFRLLSADVNEESSYHLVTSIEYFKDSDLLQDTETREVEAYTAKLGVGYAILPELHLSFQGGFFAASRERATTSQVYILSRFSSALTGTYDVGQNFFDLKANRFNLGASLWVNFSKITRFFKAPDIVPTLIASTDWSDQEVPVRAHFNLGFQQANDERYFNDGALDQDGNPIAKDFDRFGTHTLNSYAIRTGLGAEFPFPLVNPSLELHMEYVKKAGFSQSPKWMTLGVKGNPFPQKNIEVFSAVDVGLSSYKDAAANVNPVVYPIPLWNVVVGFGLSQFGKRAGEVGVDQIEYNRTVQELRERNEMIAALKKDLSYNTVQGRVTDSKTNKGIAGVSISFPDEPDLQASTTDSNGDFSRYFPHLKGARILFKKKGYESSSKFYALKPGESVKAEIELQEGNSDLQGSLVLNLIDGEGNAVIGEVLVRNLKTNVDSRVRTDRSGKLTLPLTEGQYLLQIRAPGYQSVQDRVSIEGGKAVLRSYTVTSP